MPNPLINKDTGDIELTENEVKVMDEYIKTLPKDIQLYFHKLKKKVANCNIRINNIEQLIKDIDERCQDNEDTIAILDSYVDEHEALALIVRQKNKHIDKQYLIEIAKLEEASETAKQYKDKKHNETPIVKNNDKIPPTNKPWAPGMSCVNCLWSNVEYDDKEHKATIICDGMNSPYYQKIVNVSNYCFKYYGVDKNNSKVIVYKPEKKQQKKIYIENVETNKSKESIIE